MRAISKIQNCKRVTSVKRIEYWQVAKPTELATSGSEVFSPTYIGSGALLNVGLVESQSETFLHEFVEGAAPIQPVQMVEASNTDMGAATISTSVVLPATIQEGDYLVACLFHRETADGITPPSPEWTRQLQQEAGGITLDQYAEIWTKIAVAADAGSTVTFSGSVSGRKGLIVLVTRHANGVVIEDTSFNTYDLAISPGQEVISALDSLGEGRLAVGMATCVYSQSSGTTEYTFPAEWTQHTPINLEANRLAVATKEVNLETIDPVTVTHHTSDHEAAMIGIILAANSN